MYTVLKTSDQLEKMDKNQWQRKHLLVKVSSPKPSQVPHKFQGIQLPPLDRCVRKNYLPSGHLTLRYFLNGPNRIVEQFRSLGDGDVPVRESLLVITRG